MSKLKSTEKLTRYTIGILLLLLAINAFAGGYFRMAGAKNIPTERLKNSPFHSYFVPSLILFVCWWFGSHCWHSSIQTAQDRTKSCFYL
jgi:hypothetical protein